MRCKIFSQLFDVIGWTIKAKFQDICQKNGHEIWILDGGKGDEINAIRKVIRRSVRQTELPDGSYQPLPDQSRDMSRIIR